MKISNKKNIKFLIYGLILFLLFSVFIAVAFFINIIPIHMGFATLMFAASLLVIWKIATLKNFSLEVTEHIISVKYRHPFSTGIEVPILEVPLERVFSFKINKGIFGYFLTISINTKKGRRNFCYRLGILSQKQFKQVNKALKSIKPKINIDD